jgi:hypothetical protein
MYAMGPGYVCDERPDGGSPSPYGAPPQKRATLGCAKIAGRCSRHGPERVHVVRSTVLAQEFVAVELSATCEAPGVLGRRAGGSNPELRDFGHARKGI